MTTEIGHIENRADRRYATNAGMTYFCFSSKKTPVFATTAYNCRDRGLCFQSLRSLKLGQYVCIRTGPAPNEFFSGRPGGGHDEILFFGRGPLVPGKQLPKDCGIQHRYQVSVTGNPTLCRNVLMKEVGQGADRVSSRWPTRKKSVLYLSTKKFKVYRRLQ